MCECVFPMCAMLISVEFEFRNPFVNYRTRSRRTAVKHTTSFSWRTQRVFNAAQKIFRAEEDDLYIVSAHLPLIRLRVDIICGIYAVYVCVVMWISRIIAMTTTD